MVDSILIIAGGREFYPKGISREYFFKRLNKLTSKLNVTCVICGTAAGADTFGKEWAEFNGIPVKEMPAEWDKYKKAAGYRRNVEMALVATHLIAFWDGESKGTGHMIDIMRKYKKPFKVVKYQMVGIIK